MALDLKLNITTSEDCKSLVIQDITGLYNASSNSTGWGEFNVLGNRDEFTLSMSITAYHFVGEQQYVTSIPVTNLESIIEYPNEDLLKDFKVSFSASDLSAAFALFPNMSEDFNPSWEIIEDNIYRIDVAIRKDMIGYLDISMHYLSCTCGLEAKVNKLLTAINLDGEDLADADTQQGLLAKSLLDTLKASKL